MTSLFKFSDLLSRVDKNFDGDKWKVVRHKDNRSDVPNLFQLSFTEKGQEAINFYQSWQKSNVFGKCEGIFSFVGLPQRRALFLGAYKIRSVESRLIPPPSEVPSELRDIWGTWYGDGTNALAHRTT